MKLECTYEDVIDNLGIEVSKEMIAEGIEAAYDAWIFDDGITASAVSAVYRAMEAAKQKGDSK